MRRAIALVFLSWFFCCQAHAYQDELRYLLQLRRILPDVFSASITHDVDLIGLSRKNARLALDLAPLQDGLPAPRYRIFRVENLEERDLAATKINPDSLAALRRELTGLLAGLTSPIEARIAELTRLLDQKSLEIRIHEHILSLPPEQRAAAFARPRTEFLQQLDPELVARERELRQLLLAYVLGTDSVATLSESSLDSLRDKKTRLTGLKNLGNDKAVRFFDQVLGEKQDLFTRELRTETFARETLYLAEMDPDIAVAKSFIGDDCSSAYCMGYPRSRFEHVFAVLDKDGHPRGYASVSRVTSRRGRELYLNTINGVRLNSLHTTMIVEALARMAPVLGATGIAVPPKSRVEENVNFAEIAGALSAYAAGRPYKIEFMDTDARRTIERYSEVKYDAVSNNRYAHLIKPESLQTLKLAVHEGEENPYASLEAAGEPTEFDLQMAVLDLISSNRADMARRLLALQPDAALSELLLRNADAVANNERLPAAVYEERMHAWLRELKAPGDPAMFMTENPDYFRIGYILAADSLQPASRERTVERLVKLVDTTGVPQSLKDWAVQLPSESKLDLAVEIGHRALAAARDRKAEERVVFGTDRPSWRRADFLASLIGYEEWQRKYADLQMRGLSLAQVIILEGELGIRRQPIVFGVKGFPAAIERGLTGTKNADAYLKLAAELSAETAAKAHEFVAPSIVRTLHQFAALNPSAEQIRELSGILDGGDELPAILRWHEKMRTFHSSGDAVKSLSTFDPLALTPDAQSAILVTFAQSLNAFSEVRTPDLVYLLNRFQEPSPQRRTLVAEAVRRATSLDEYLSAVDVGTRTEPFINSIFKDEIDQYILFIYTTAAFKVAAPVLTPYMRETGERHRALLEAKSAEEFLAVIREPLASDPEGEYTDDRRHTKMFLRLNPTLSQFRQLLRSPGYSQGLLYGLELVHSLKDLRKLVARPRLPDRVRPYWPQMVYQTVREWIETGHSGVDVTEADIDRLFASPGLEPFRFHLPPVIQERCEVKLAGPAN